MTLNPRIALSLASIAAAGALAVGATFAFFSDSTQVLGNTFTTGNADLQIAVDSSNSAGTYGGSIVGVNFTGIEPGFTGQKLFWLKNNSSSTITLDLKSDLANLGGSFHGTDGSLPDKLYVRFRCDSDNDGLGDTEDTVTGEFSVNTWITGGDDSLGSLAQNAQVQCRMEARLDSGAGNEIANGNISFDAIFNGNQAP